MPIFGGLHSCRYAPLIYFLLGAKWTDVQQLQGLAKHRGTGDYGLMAPHLHRIAPRLVMRASLQPSVLVEICQFITVTTSQFISLTQSVTLPRLFAACDLRTLQLVSTELGIPLLNLFMRYGAAILSYIFCQPTNHTKMTNFVVSTLAVTPGSESIDLASIIRSYYVDLLAEIIAVMGEEAEGSFDKVCKFNRIVFVTYLTLPLGCSCTAQGGECLEHPQRFKTFFRG